MKCYGEQPCGMQVLQVLIYNRVQFHCFYLFSNEYHGVPCRQLFQMSHLILNYDLVQLFLLSEKD